MQPEDILLEHKRKQAILGYMLYASRLLICQITMKYLFFDTSDKIYILFKVDILHTHTHVAGVAREAGCVHHIQSI